MSFTQHALSAIAKRCQRLDSSPGGLAMSGQYLASRCYSLLNDAEATRQSSYIGRPMARKNKWAGWTSAYSAGPGQGPRENLPQPEQSFVKTESEKEREWERRDIFCVQDEMQAETKSPQVPTSTNFQILYTHLIWPGKHTHTDLLRHSKSWFCEHTYAQGRAEHS